MADIMTPALGESVTEATVARWTKKAGDPVRKDEILVELETDKVSLEVAASADGVLSEITAAEGATVERGSVLGRITEGAVAAKAPAAPAPKAEAAPPAPATAKAAVEPVLAPSAQRVVAENKLDASAITGSDKGGRVTKGDALAALEARAKAPPAAPVAPAAPREIHEREERVRMTRLRQTIARRLKEAQNNAAMLTTFNEVDMGAVMALRNSYKDVFEKTHGVKLGFMSFFVKAAVEALKTFPAVNASLDGEEVVFHHYYDVSEAVSGSRGLVTPVIRDADQKSMAELEKVIAEFGQKAKNDKLTLADLQGGTFTITNGGIFGSMLSTPILNPPQTGILGMHNIQERPVVRNGEIVARPMMYLALSYDHRLIDGREAVQFLVRIKDVLEAPERMLLEI